MGLEEVVRHRIIRGAVIGDGGLLLSQLFYVDDALFSTEWDEQNIKNLVAITNCFYLVSDLNLNLNKSYFYRIRLPFHCVEEMVGITGYDPACIPFSYLGLSVGANMSRSVNVNLVIHKFHKKLASWKVNLLSVGGRLTLIKSILNSIGIYYMFVFKMPEHVNFALGSLRSRYFLGW